MLKQILIIHIIDLDRIVREVFKEFGVQREPQDREDVSDAGFLQGLFTADGEETTIKAIRTTSRFSHTYTLFRY